MGRPGWYFFFVIGLATAAFADAPTAKRVFGANANAVVQVYVDGRYSGSGFLVSSDGVIVTANHVVATRESALRQFATTIQVRIPRRKEPYSAKPVSTIDDDSLSADIALIKIESTGLPFLDLGRWEDVETGDPVVVIASLPVNATPLLFEGIVSAKGRAKWGSKPVDTMLFQSPVRSGFSGAPVFSADGKVIGIVNTKVFGISRALSDMRTHLAETNRRGTISLGPVDLGQSVVELTNVLDENLISGMGSAVSVEYARALWRRKP
jgi:S1-C subfamily serine protease